MNRVMIASVGLSLLLSACASGSEDIAAFYVSPLHYEQFSCEQLAAEGQRVSSRAAIAAGQQDKDRTKDAVATGVGVVLFWPTLFMIKGDGPKAAELARLKGEMDAIEAAAITKRCQIKFQRT